MKILNKKFNKIIILTAIFGDYDILHSQPDLPNVSYVCITDNPGRLKNNSYNYTVIDYQEFKNIKSSWSPRKKTYYIRYHLFELFNNASYIIWHDSDLSLNETILSHYLEMCETNKYDFYYLSNFNLGHNIKEYFERSSWIYQTVFSYDIQRNFYDKNKSFIHKHDNIKICHGKFRIVKNTKENQLFLQEIYNFLINIEPNDYIFILDEPITGIILSKYKINVFDISLDDNWYQELPFEQKLHVFYHNSNDYRSTLSFT